ncbi:Mu transposase C-terminal domain-containing protein [Almyronema epifaneia]|uniref:Mu transposase C-terminal domain-containing protein n=1 Tax=Almyronema epifaneia S1 TaxID=2991925 RepID=A0ABW6IN02_9CYAN
MTNNEARENCEKSEECETIAIWRIEDFSIEEHRRFRVISRLQLHRGQGSYREAEIQAAQELGLSVRSIKRLVRHYRESGIAGLKRQPRSDAGQLKLEPEWQEFIIKTYRQGNRGMRCLRRSQVAKLVELRAAELGESDYPSRRSVYRILAPEIARKEQESKKRSPGWSGEKLELRTKEGIEIKIDYSNQVWQCDHTLADIVVVDSHGEPLGRPTLTTVIDTYSRCVMGIHLGMERPSAAVTCLALRHSILPKQYRADYEPQKLWESYGVPRYLYSDAGSDLTSSHIDQIASRLGITLCLRRRPAEGGIVERPFGTFNSEFFSTLPGYTTAYAKPHLGQIKAEACLTLEQLDGLLVRYIVDNYNQQPDARSSQESRMARWKSGQMVAGPLLSDREVDILLMRQNRRRVYQGGYIRFANLLYRGEYLSGYAGEEVVLRYDPSDITTVWVYRQQGAEDVFLARAHAQNLETECLSLAEAKAISRRLRETQREITNESVLMEIRDRLRFVEQLRSTDELDLPESEETGQPPKKKPSSPLRLYDYDQLF